MPRKQLQPRRLLQRLWRDSWTTVWGQAKILVGLSVAGFHYIGNMVNDPNVKDALSAVTLPVYLGLGLAVIGFVTTLSAEHK